MTISRTETTNLHQLHTLLVKKSVTISISMWMRMNSRHVMVFFRSGAGAMPWRFRMLPTV
jgi:hypothetical protein